MKIKKAITQTTYCRYRKANHKQKTLLLDEFVHITGYNRNYAARILRTSHKTMSVSDGNKTMIYKATPHLCAQSGRPPTYAPDILLPILIKIWDLFNNLCGKRLAPLIRTHITHFVSHYTLSSQQITLLKNISPATIDRLLAQEKRTRRLTRGNSYTHASSLHQLIPYRTSSEMKDAPLGTLQCDTVGHDGGKVGGQCSFTLTATDISSQWVCKRALLNRASVHVIKRFDEILASTPFPILALHPDGGSEFINHAMYSYAQTHAIDYSRSRPGKKNDNCYIEQKNYDSVRKTVGYARYMGLESTHLLNQFYILHDMLQNFVLPSQKIIKKTYIGSRQVKKYDAPATPAQRILAMDTVSDEIIQRITDMQSRIDPIALALEARTLLHKVWNAADKNLDAPFPKGRESTF